MSAIAIYTAPYNAWVAPRNSFALWGKQMSAAMQSLGVTKTTLYGTGWISSRFSDFYQGIAQTQANFTVPLHVQTNDFMLVTIAVVAGTTVTTPVGWTLQYTDTGAGTVPVVQYVFYRFAGVADVGTGINYVFNLSASVTVSGTFGVYVGVNTTTPINIAGVALSAANGTVATAPTVTTTAPNCEVVQCWAADFASYLWTFSAGTVRAYANQASLISGAQNAVTDAVQLASGATPQPTATFNVTGSWIARTIALNPAVPVFAIGSITDTSLGGTLADATYAYRIVATNAQGHTLPCTEVTHVVANGTGTSTTTTTWNVVPNATGYQVYGRTSGSELLMATLLSPNGSILSWTDNGGLTPLGAMPITDTTTDTGQINWGAVGLTAGGVSAGYEIVQFTDSQQAYAPVFLRLSYGTGAAGANAPMLTLITGTSTDGVGNPTSALAFPGTVSPSKQLFATTMGGNANSLVPVYVDSDGGASLMIAGWYNPPLLGTTNSVCAVIERTRNWDGTPNAEGIIILSNNANTATHRTIMLANAANFTSQQNENSYWPVPYSTFNSVVPLNTMMIGTTVFTVPVFTGYTPRLNAPSKHVVGIMLDDTFANTQFTIQPYGQNHVFVSMGLTSSGMVNLQVSSLSNHLTVAFRIS